jgi:hypothetical protein
MMLKTFIATEEEIPENLKDFYTKSEDQEGFVLEVDLDSQKEIKRKIKEFRDTNIGLQKEMADFREKMAPFENLDPEEVKQALEARAKVQKEELLPRGEIEKHIAARLKDSKEAYEKEIADARRSADSFRNELNSMMIEKTVTEALNRVGQLQKGALSDVLRRARLEMEVKDGNILERDSGLTLDPLQWAGGLMKDCPYFFVPNTGMNAKGSGEATNEINPWKDGSVNLTEQGRLFREDRAKAERLAAEAGKSI